MTPPQTKEDKLAVVRDAAREYFTRRDELEEGKDEMLAAMLDAAEVGGATQQEIADMCDLTDGNPEDWQFHRTRIQQFLLEARRASRRPAA